MVNEWKRYLFVALCFRMISMLVVRTSFAPDEYWQSLEVAHSYVFGIGYLTWEWVERIRSSIYPLLISALYYVLKVSSLDNYNYLVFGPRVLQAILTSVSDMFMFRWLINFGSSVIWSVTLINANWFLFYCGTRTLINTFEYTITVIALYFYPWQIMYSYGPGRSDHGKKKLSDSYSLRYSWYNKHSWKYIALSSLICMVRPTAATIWAPLVFFHFRNSLTYETKVKFFKLLLLVSTIVCSLCVCVDSLFYKAFVFTPFNFLHFNLLKNVSSFYGTHPPYWYLVQGVPTLLGVAAVPFLLRAKTIIRWGFESTDTATVDRYKEVEKKIFIVIILNIVIYSLIGHKEHRFLLPLLPLFTFIAARYFSFSEMSGRVRKVWMGCFAVGFILPAVYFGVIHQQGTLSLMRYLHKESSANPSQVSLMFLMPCHSTPLYSHLHYNVTTKFLTCDPPLRKEAVDEAAVFYIHPGSWLYKYYRAGNQRPTHMIFFESLLPAINEFLFDYEKAEEFYHTPIVGMSRGVFIFVYKLMPSLS